MRTKNCYILLIFCWLYTFQSFAFDGPPVNFLGIEQGLSNNIVTSIYQDHNGFMWFGTYDGLNRYDGYTFKIFRNSIGDTTSLSGNHVYTIDGDASHKLWVGCEKGLSVFDPVRSAFSYPSLRSWNGGSLQSLQGGIPTLKAINNGETMLVGTDAKGLVVFEKEEAVGRQIPLASPVGLTGNYTVNSMEFDQFRHLVWVFVSQVGLCQYDITSRRLKVVNPSVKQANCLKVDHLGRLWIGNDNGLFLYSVNTGTLSLNLLPSHSRITSLFEDKQSILWIASDGEGVWFLPPTTGKPAAYVDDSGEAIVNSNAVYAIYGDKEGRKWIGTLRGGVNVIHPRTSSFRTIMYNVQGQNNIVNNFVLSFCDDESGNLWIGTDGAGLRYWNRNKNTYIKYAANPSAPGAISSNFVTGLMRDSHNDLWVATWFGGVNRLKNGSRTFEHFTCFNPQTKAAENNTWIVYEDAQKRIWASTTNNGTLYLFNRTTNRFELFDNTITNIQCLAEDSQGNFWGGNYTSLVLIDRVHKKHQTYKIGYTIRCIHEDGDKNFWIGTEGGGLLLFDRKKGSSQRFTTADGLPSNTILRLLEDQKHNLWLSTYNGICKFNTLSKISRNFTQSDGLQSNQFSFNAAQALKTGEFLFGGIKGFNLFHPDSIYDKGEVPRSFLTGLRINNTPVEEDGSNVTKRLFEKITQVTLPYDKAVLSLDFIALEYTGGDKIKYSYLLEGWDKTWNYSNNYRTANYSRLREGEYNFKIKVTTADGVWGGETQLLRIIVLPPWYRTWWAYLFYGLVLIGGVYLYIIYNARQERLKYEVQLTRLEKEKEKEIVEKKLSFFTHISHEFRTPLTLIINPIRDMLEKEDEEEEKRELSIVYRNARRLRSLVDQLLIFRRADLEADKMNITKLNFYELCHDVFLCFLQQAKMNHQDYHFEAENKDLELYVDRQKMEITLYNLVSNAIKYTPNGGTIIFRITESQHEVEVSVSDTGYGIPRESASRLFEKFYQAENAPVKSGFGIGLYLVKHFVESHKGSISFESEEGVGTTFHVRFKKEREHFGIGETITDQSTMPPRANDHVFLTEDELPVAQAPNENKLDEVTNGRQTILVVDDDQGIRHYLLQILGDKYGVMEASNGQQALEIVQKQFPDLVISDIQMEVMDGIEMCRRIKKDQALNHIPVILLTGSFAHATELESLEGGADAYITKPFDKDILLVRIENIFKSRTELQNYFFNEITLKKNTHKISSEYKDFLERCIAIVEQHLDDDQFSIKTLAKEIGMSHSNLYKKVKLVSGQSVTGFVRYIRLRKAAELLIKTDCNINQAAFQVGINDIKYFRTQFNKLFGMNPSEYMKKYRQPFNKEYNLSASVLKEKTGK